MAHPIVGEGGYLFLNNDSNKSIEQFEGRFKLELDEIHKLCLAHVARAVAVDSFGVYLHVVVPNKETVLTHLMPQKYKFQEFGLTPYNLYVDVAFPAQYRSFFQPNHLLRLHGGKATYAKLDTHWTHFGAYSYLRECFRRLEMQIEVVAFDSVRVKTATIFQRGDLGSKIGLPNEELSSTSPVCPQATTVVDNNIGNVGRVRYFKNEQAPVSKKFLLLHDSTAEWVISLICEMFTEVITIHCPDCDLCFVEKLRPDIFMFLQIERFFVRGISNKLDLLQFVGEQEAKKGGTRSVIPFLSRILGH